MIIPRVTKITYDTPPGEAREIYERGMRKGMRKATLTWQREIAPGHFAWGAQGKYGYQRRSRKYRARKLREHGHRLPLVFTGDSLEWVKTRFAKPRTRRTQTGIRATLPVKVPQYFFMYRGTGPDKYAELTTTLPQEYEYLFEIIDLDIQREKARRPRKRTVSVGTA